ncbi:hypothetical protein CC1G_09065 [Coprinopsis cinerea okayama7|uniref:MYND-type domain-containing protein n=1 Tax=Coprinopsis cinerea (strain Okayama-7 / 130 / ATCC MYA-4618 / FGSC 9003) TaxID=240176 RepID=A8P302_COPC7|nr:hypothetical protein CC1G_09065 [Coprinopsis cinerea okayama7\|eukprot:XP_001838437.2 hypothetical protein CC1G_09065 [Coprinopsis cinerea okayama7\
MSAIPPKIIAQAKSYDASVFKLIYDRIVPRNYSIPLLESLLTHFQMDKLPKATSHSAIESLFKAKPMLSIMSCLSRCLDNCYYTETQLQSTTDKVHDCIEGILSWTLLFVNHIFSPKSKHGLEMKNRVGHRACLLLSRLLRLDTRIDQVVAESEKTFEVMLTSWITCDIITLSSSALFALILREHMDETLERFEKTSFIAYLLSDEKRLVRLAKGVVAHLDRVREILESSVQLTDETVVPFNRLSHNQSVYRALRRAGFLQSWVKTLVACLDQPVDLDFTMLLAANTLRMSYQAHASPWSGLEAVIEAGIHDVLLQCMKNDASGTSNELYIYFLKVYSHYANHPRGIKLLEPIIMSLEIPEDCVEISVDAFRTRVDLLQRMDESPHLFTLCDNESHGSMVKDEKALVVKGKGPEGVATCSNCHSAFYCDPICQKEDWTRRHKAQCSALRSRYIENESSKALVSYQYRLFSIQLSLSTLDGIEDGSVTPFPIPNLASEFPDWLNVPSSGTDIMAVELISIMCHEPAAILVTMDHFVDTHSAAKIGPVAAERVREMATAVVQKRKKGSQSKLVASILTAVPQYQFVLIMEVEKDVKSGKYVCLQHVASIRDRLHSPFGNGVLTQSPIEPDVMDTASYEITVDQRGEQVYL